MIGQAVSPRQAPQPQLAPVTPRSEVPDLTGALDPFAMAEFASAEGGGLEAARHILAQDGQLPPPEDDPRSMAEKYASLDAGVAEADALMDDPSLSIEDIEERLPEIELRWAMRSLVLVPGPDDTLLVEGEVNPKKKGKKKKEEKKEGMEIEDEPQAKLKRKEEDLEHEEAPPQKKNKQKEADPNALVMDSVGQSARTWIEGLSAERLGQARSIDKALTSKEESKEEAEKKVPEKNELDLAAEAFCKNYQLPSLTAQQKDHPIGEVAISHRRVQSAGKQEKPKGEKQPGYVFGTLLTQPSEIEATLKNYSTQAWGESEDGGVGRSQVVIGLNRPTPIDGKDPFASVKLPDAPFSYTVVSFTWSTGLRALPYGAPCTLEDVRADLAKAEKKAPGIQALVEERFYRGRFTEETKMERVPYGALREEIMPETKQAVGSLSALCDPVYLHIGDPDALDWRVNCGHEGVLTHMDGVLAKRAESGLPQMIAGGYNFGRYNPDEDPMLNAARFGNELDRHLRVDLGKVAPHVSYPTEPNLFVRAHDDKAHYDLFSNKKLFDPGSGRVKKQGALMGIKNAEGNALRTKMFKAEGLDTRDPKNFLYEEASITTTAPGRVLKSTSGKTPYARLFEHEQSFAKPGALFRSPPKNQKGVWEGVREAFHEKLEETGKEKDIDET
jgi:hypothetical protein